MSALVRLGLPSALVCLAAACQEIVQSSKVTANSATNLVSQFAPHCAALWACRGSARHAVRYSELAKSDRWLLAQRFISVCPDMQLFSLLRPAFVCPGRPGLPRSAFVFLGPPLSAFACWFSLVRFGEPWPAKVFVVSLETSQLGLALSPYL